MAGLDTRGSLRDHTQTIALAHAAVGTLLGLLGGMLLGLSLLIDVYWV